MNAWTRVLFAMMVVLRAKADTSAFPKGIMIIGGKTANGKPNVEFYGGAPNASFTPPKLNHNRISMAAVVFDGCIYAIGGEETIPDFEPVGTVEILCPSDTKWKSGPSLAVERKGPAAAVLNDGILVCGGWHLDFVERLKSCEYLSRQRNGWIPATPMLASRDDAPAATVNGKYYVIGGYNRTSREMKTVEVYDPSTGNWSYVASMKFARAHHGVSVLGSFIYVCGGHGHGGNRKSCEKYDPSRNTWSSIASMPDNRDDFAMVAFDGKIYALGGETQRGGTKAVEIYDPATDTWTSGTPLKYTRSHHAAVSL